MQTFFQKLKSIHLIAILLLVVAGTYLPSLNNGFTSWDDEDNVTKNYDIRELSFASTKTFFTQYVVGNYHPLTTLSHALVYHFAQLNPLPHHLLNLILHMVNVLLVFWLIYLLTSHTWKAFFVALLFGIHPMQVESVAWVTERKDVLYVLFYLSALITYIYYHRSHFAMRYYVLVFFLFLCGLFSKVTTVSLPITLLAFDYFLKRKFTWRMILEKIPLLGFSFLFGIIAIKGAVALNVVGRNAIYTFFQRLCIGGYLFSMYILKIILPLKLSCDYPHPGLFHGHLGFDIYFFLTVSIALTLFILTTATKTRVYVFGLLFYALTIALGLQIFMVGDAFFADRFSYLPSVGLFFILVHLLDTPKIRDRHLFSKNWCLSLIFIYLTFLIATSFIRCHVWKDNLSLWTDAVDKYPGIPVPYNNRGMAYLELNRLDLALKDFQRAVLINPKHSSAYNNIGMIYDQYNRPDLALEQYNKAIETENDNEKAYYNRGLLYQRHGKLDLALTDYEKASKINFKHIDIYVNRGVIYLNQKKYDLAEKNFLTALSIDPTYVGALNNLGLVYTNTGDYRRASATFKHCQTIDPRYPECYYNDALALKNEEKWQEAVAELTKTIALNPNYFDAYFMRGEIFMQQSQFEQSIKDFTQCLRIDPNYAEGYFYRGIALGMMGELDQALTDFDKTILLSPSEPAAYFNRSLIFLRKKDFDKAKENALKAKSLGMEVSESYLKQLN